MKQKTTVNCPDWRPHSNLAGGECVNADAIKRTGAHPSLNTCELNCAIRPRPFVPANYTPLTIAGRLNQAVASLAGHQATGTSRKHTPTAKATPAQSWKLHRGPAKWAELHRRPGEITADKLSDEIRWLESFAKSIRCGECRDHWREIVAQNPPDLSSLVAYFAWTVTAHNTINQSIGKPVMSVDDANKRWGRLAPLTSEQMRGYFAGVYVISLKRTPERLAAFWERFPADWAFGCPEVFEAVDGGQDASPHGWRGGSGAWGLMKSNLLLLDRLITEGVNSPVLVMEDDCEFVPGSSIRWPAFLAGIPSDADLAFPGGQHFQNTTPFNSEVVRCTDIGRTHAVIWYPRYFHRLRDEWQAWNSHIDHWLQRATQSHHYYAASPFFAIQSSNFSTIRNRQEPSRSWDGNVSVSTRRADEVPVIVLDAPREVVDALRGLGMAHFGYWRNDQAIDRGIEDLMRLPPDARVPAMRSWLNIVRDESAAFPHAACAIWHPSATVKLLQDADVDRPRLVSARTLSEAIGKIRAVIDGQDWPTFTHSGKLGDLIYSLPSIQAMGGGNLVLTNRPDQTGMEMTLEAVESFRQLLMAQPYIKSISFSPSPPKDAIDLDRWREHWRDGPTIADKHLAAFKLPREERERPWLHVEPFRVGPVIIARSGRYHNDRFPWRRVLQTYPHAVFVGLPDEHAAFVCEFGEVPRHPTTDLWELARAIAGCDLFIGNQSAPLAIAHGLGKPVVIEVSPGDANCTFDRPNELQGWNESTVLPDPTVPRITILTGCDEAFRIVLEPTLPTKRAYCKQHGIKFVNRPYREKPWGERQALMMEELPGCDWLWFQDADTIITNPAIDIRTFCDSAFDVIIATDKLGINNGSLLLHNTPATSQFLRDVLARNAIDDNDQIAMQKGFDASDGLRVKYVSQRLFNSFPETEYGRPDDPKYAWREGDLLLHLAGLSMSRRLTLISTHSESASG